MQYHFDHQKGSRLKNTIIFDDHAHDIVGDSALWNCIVPLWPKMAAGRSLEFRGPTIQFLQKLCQN